MWNVVTKDNNNYPDTDRFVVGFFIEGADPFVDLCQYLRDFDIWVDDSDNLIDAPDYWTETPENEEKNERLDRK